MLLKTLALHGCAPVPLAHYLKALGILRLVSEQADPAACGRWHRDHFELVSTLDRGELLRFFLGSYQPTPVLAPWNGGSGFHPKDNSRALETILASAAGRLTNYATSIRAAFSALRGMQLGEKPTPAQKADLLLICRNVLPDAALQWLDAAYVLTDDGAKFPPLLGTGGNDGRLEFTNHFMQRIIGVMDPDKGTPVGNSRDWLTASLFADGSGTPPAKAPVGQFFPGTAGGANATAGFDAASAVNPWDFILMIEGALLFASASVKRLENQDNGTLPFPFCVRQAGVGYASATRSDESASRAEMWMPLWTKRDTTLQELMAIFSEGRAQVGSREARNGVDFARAVVSLGVDRGLDEFQRFGFQARNGLSYFATPLTRLAARRNPSVDLLDDVDVWLDRFRRVVTKDSAPASARRALSVLEARILDLCASRSEERLLRVFLALGHCQATISRSLNWAMESFLPPLGGLRREWLEHGWNGEYGREFRLAASLASITGKFGKDWLPLRCHLEQVNSLPAKGGAPLSFRWAAPPTNAVQWSGAPLPEVLNAILSRRLTLNEEPLKHRSELPAALSDIKAFIERKTDDALLSGLLWSMGLIDWRERRDVPETSGDHVVPPMLYAMLKLCFPPARDSQPQHIQPVPSVPAIHRQAALGHGTESASLALARLRASGYRPKISGLTMQGDHAKRTAAALLFPISDSTLALLRQQTERPREVNQNSGFFRTAQ